MNNKLKSNIILPEIKDFVEIMPSRWKNLG